MSYNTSASVGELYLSNDGQYLINNEKIYFAAENKSYSLDEISLPTWIDILCENTLFSLKHNLVEVKELSLYHRKVTYQIFESLPFDIKSTLILEYEMKFGNQLLTESVVLSEAFFANAWSWMKEKAKKFGATGKRVIQNITNCVSGRGCSPLFESFREALYSPVGIGINMFLAITGIGRLGLVVMWGMMLLWDIYLLMTGSPDFTWLNVIFDVLGIGLGAYASASRNLFGGAKAVLQTKGKTLPEVIAFGMKNPKTAKIFKEFGKITSGGGMSKIMNSITKAGDFLSKKLGFKWASGVTNKVSTEIGKVSNAIGIETKQAAQTTVKSGLTPAIASTTKVAVPAATTAPLASASLEVKEAASLTSPSTSNQTTGSVASSDASSSSTASSSSSPTATSDIGTSSGAADYPPYPEVGHWESGVTRGPANQIDTKSNWSDVVGSKLTRGKANPLKEDIYVNNPKNMEKNKKTINESVEKIKYMMNYDSSKTRFENKGTLQMEQVKPGEMAWKTGAGVVGANVAARILAPIIATKMGAATGAVYAGAVAGPVAAIAALGLIPLVLWLNDKDKVKPKVQKLFNYVKTEKEKIDKVPRGLGDEDIWNASDELFNAMKRLGTRERDVYKVFESLQTISDLGALITFYEQDNGISLLEQLDRDFDQTREWMQIYRPIRNLVLKFAIQMGEENKILDQQKTQQNQQVTGGDNTVSDAGYNSPVTGGYNPVMGTIEEPFRYGTSGRGIAQVQQALGVAQDGKWGPKTDSKIKELASEYANGFTNEDLGNVIQKIKSKYNAMMPKINLPKFEPKADTKTLNNPMIANAGDQYGETK